MNLSKIKREEMLDFLDELRKEHDDKESLRALNEIETALTEKKYGLVWEEHSEKVDEMLEHNIPIFVEDEVRKIVSDENKPFNFLLEGDNLHSLKLLEKTYKGKIGVIYIDPPYNMGKDDFIYNDNYVDKEDGFRHSKWLSFMNERLRIAHNLLSDDGIIAISIDENEFAPLKMLCDEIFNEDNNLINLHVQVRYANKSLNEKNDWQPLMEYVLIYAKNSDDFEANRPFEEYNIKGFNQEIIELTEGEELEINNKKVVIFKKGEWKRVKKKKPDINLLKATWITGSIYSDTGHGTNYQKIVEPRYEIDGYGSLYKIYGLGEDGLGYRYMRNPNSARYTKGEMFTGVPLERLKEMESDEGSKKYKPIVNYIDYSAEFGNIRHEGNMPFNKGKKPVKMIKEIINYHKGKDIIVLDFFAGSGSTGHAIEQLNKEDGGTRKYILCTNNENNICEEITYKRLTNIQKELPHNLKYYKTDFIPKITDDENVKEKMLKNIKPLIELEYQTEIDNIHNIIVMEEKDIMSVLENALNGVNVFVSSDIMLSQEEKTLASKKGINIITIPEYYYKDELREVGEL